MIVFNKYFTPSEKTFSVKGVSERVTQSAQIKKRKLRKNILTKDNQNFLKLIGLK